MSSHNESGSASSAGLYMAPALAGSDPLRQALGVNVLFAIKRADSMRSLFLLFLVSEHGLWYARSAEFVQTDHVQTLRWLRVIGDTIFGVGVVAFVWFGLRRKAS